MPVPQLEVLDNPEVQAGDLVLQAGNPELKEGAPQLENLPELGHTRYEEPDKLDKNGSFLGESLS